MNRRLLLASACLFFALGSGGPAYALRMSPFKATIDPEQKNRTQVFHVENNSDEPAAVQVSVLNWEMNPDGTETNADAGDSFSVYPAQIVLKPHESRGVRVQWTGDGLADAEKAYRVLIEQIATNLNGRSEQKTGVQFMLKFLAALYVTPEKAQPDIIVKSYDVTDGDRLRLSLSNDGTAHVLLKNPSLELEMANGEIVELAGDVLKPVEGENIHAGKNRTFDIVLPQKTNIPVKSAKISFDHGF